MNTELREFIDKIEHEDIDSRFDSLKHLNAVILATTIINGNYSADYLNDLKNIINKTLKLPTSANVMLNNIIADKLQKINN